MESSQIIGLTIYAIVFLLVCYSGWRLGTNERLAREAAEAKARAAKIHTFETGRMSDDYFASKASRPTKPIRYTTKKRG